MRPPESAINRKSRHLRRGDCGMLEMRPILVGLALLCMLIVDSWGQSQGPSPTPAKGSQTQQEQASGEKGVTKPDNQPAKNPPPAIQQPNPEIAVRYDQHFGDKGKDAAAWRDWPAWAVAIFTLGLLITAIFQWLAMHGQRKLMAAQLEEMKTTSADTHALAIAVGDAAKAATKSADSAELAIETDPGFDTGRSFLKLISDGLAVSIKQSEGAPT